MPVNQYVNKLVKDGVTKFDLTADTVTSATLAEGATAHNAAGEQITGTMQGGLEMNVKFTTGNKTIPKSIFCNNHGSGTNVYGYSTIEEVVIGDGVTSIGDRAFGGCTGLTSVTIPDSVTSIGTYAFVTCTGLTNITIPNSVTSIGASAFNFCSNLTTITIDKPQDSISGAPWGAPNATVVWTG